MPEAPRESPNGTTEKLSEDARLPDRRAREGGEDAASDGGGHPRHLAVGRARSRTRSWRGWTAGECALGRGAFRTTPLISRRGHPLDAPELPDEMALVGKPDRQGHVGGAVTSAEHAPRVEDAHQELVGVWRKPDLAGEGAQQPELVHVRKSRKLVERDRARVSPVDVLLHLANSFAKHPLASIPTVASMQVE